MGISPIVQPLLQSHHSIVGIIECAPRSDGKSNKEKQARRFVRSLYCRLRKRPSSLKELAAGKQIPYYYMSEGSDKALEEWVKARNPDLIAIFSMSQLLKENVFSIPPQGAINLHPALLPKYRGPNPWFWMYYDLDLHPGATIHYIDSGEDTGDIIYQEGFDISLGSPFQEIYDKAILDVGTRLLIQAIDDISTGKAPRHPQPKESPTRRACNVAASEGSSLIDWEKWPAQRIWHFLRGAAQWTDIHANLKNRNKWRIWEIGEYETGERNYAFTPGKVYWQGGRTFLACRDGKIFMHKRFSAKHFFRACLNKLRFSYE
jgi:methionyl-tRNA formyltransferase